LSPRKRGTSDKAKLVRIIRRLPFPEESKNEWLEEINSAGLSEYLVKEIRSKLPELPLPEEDNVLRRKQDLADLNIQFRHWRLEQNLDTFRRQR